ncbi:hypothetical protein L6164_004998 [Bauhinia variegata]|uniref:Uncharacterized protein n=1 Tax=Bauhinia variegata TaxID=167791 RepID=A0ACB9PSI1_BAUVA|nr:hypothetical protein L6164_004998 [Bauhinia variegata]
MRFKISGFELLVSISWFKLTRLFFARGRRSIDLFDLLLVLNFGSAIQLGFSLVLRYFILVLLIEFCYQVVLLNCQCLFFYYHFLRKILSGCQSQGGLEFQWARYSPQIATVKSLCPVVRFYGTTRDSVFSSMIHT